MISQEEDFIFKSKRIYNLSMNYSIKNILFTSGSFSITQDPESSEHNSYLLNFRLYKNIKLNKKIVMNKKNKHHDKNPNLNVNVSLNYFVKLNSNFTIIDENKILIPSSVNEIIYSINKYDKYIIGIEDMKIFNFNGIIKIIGTSQNNNRQVKGIIGDYNYNENKIDNIKYINVTFNKQKVEKNWVYFKNLNEKLKIIYKWFPLQICSTYKNNLILTRQLKMPFFFENARGSTCGIHFNNEIWFICHFNENGNYYHFFSVFDLSMNLKKYSNKFKFEGCRIEFCIGFEIKQMNFIICYSLNDDISKLALYDISRLDELNWVKII